ncbi:hypothetical protein JCGZ_03242 [Jatropha curcas]|uniref:Uncharacterized protein n=1 Tax=Jatropha curcas TaxID=180498 RepID=A0A067KY71_JATCU|nr:hypothetical protein JCGZ_03242 [Jatropha curcas]
MSEIEIFRLGRSAAAPLFKFRFCRSKLGLKRAQRRMEKVAIGEGGWSRPVALESPENRENERVRPFPIGREYAALLFVAVL